jgi:hypothetical protein
MSSDNKIIIPYDGKGKYILYPVNVPYVGLALGTAERLKIMSASLAAMEASLAALIAAGGVITERLVIDYDGTTPTVTSDTYGGVTVANVTSTTFRITSLTGLFSNPIFIVNTYPDVNWTKENNSNYLFELPGDYTGAAFTIKFWEES